MNDQLLKPGEVRKLNESLARCAQCGILIQRMKQLGLNTEELEKRKAAQEMLMTGMLEVNRATQQS